MIKNIITKYSGIVVVFTIILLGYILSLSVSENLECKVNLSRNISNDKISSMVENIVLEPVMDNNNTGVIFISIDTEEINITPGKEMDVDKVLEQADLNCINYSTKSETLDGFTVYDDTIQYYSEKHSNEYIIYPNLVKSLILQESGGNINSSNGFAYGILQIENSLYTEFRDYGLSEYNEYWSMSDRADPDKSIDFVCMKISTYLDMYEGDYLKSIQAYNYSHYSLNKLIKTYGDDWIENRINMASLNGKSRYGDSKYIENVLKFYK